MLTCPLWIVLAGTLSLPAETPGALVDRLASDRPGERRAAAEALEQLGVSARPALLEARHSDDLELRARAAALLDTIEGRQLVRETPVVLDFRDRPTIEVIETIGNRTGMPLELAPGNNPMGQDRPITLEADGPVPYWEAIERLCRVAALRVASEQETWQARRNFGGQIGIFGDPPRRPRTGRERLLLPAAGGDPAPVSIVGAFRIAVQSVSLRRDRALEPPAAARRGRQKRTP